MAAGTRGSARKASKKKKSVAKVASKKATKKTTKKVSRKVTKKPAGKKKVTKKKATVIVTKKVTRKATPKKTTKAGPGKTTKSLRGDNKVAPAEVEALEAKLTAYAVKQKVLEKKLREREAEISELKETTLLERKEGRPGSSPEHNFLSSLAQGFSDLDDFEDDIDETDNGDDDLAPTVKDGDTSFDLDGEAMADEPIYSKSTQSNNLEYDDYSDDMDYMDQDKGTSERRRELDRERADRELELEDEDFWLICPKCGEHLGEHDFDNIKVERCESCGVVCIDKGEIELLFSSEEPHTIAYRAKGLLQ